MNKSSGNIRMYRNNFITQRNKSSKFHQSTTGSLFNIKNPQIPSKSFFNINTAEQDFKFYETQMNYYYLEINKKNKRIAELKNIISNLIENKEDKSTPEISYKRPSEKINQKRNFESEPLHVYNSKKNENDYILKIKKLEKENSLLRQQINKNRKKEELLYEKINEKLLKAEKDIKVLSNENFNNYNLLLAIQNFLFNISEKILPNHNKEKESELIFDLSLVDADTFINNLQILESNINNKIFELKKIGDICLSERKSDFLYTGIVENNNKTCENFKKSVFLCDDVNNLNKSRRNKSNDTVKIISRKFNSKNKKIGSKFNCRRNLNKLCLNNGDVHLEPQKPMKYSKTKTNIKTNLKKGNSASYRNIKNSIFFEYGNSKNETTNKINKKIF